MKKIAALFLTILLGATLSGCCTITYNQFLYPSGAILQEYVVEIDPAFSDGKGHTAEDVKTIVKTIFEQNEYRVSVDDEGKVHGARYFASYTDYYVYYGLTGNEHPKEASERVEGFWERKIISTRETVFAKFDDKAFVDSIAQKYFSEYAALEKENFRFIYNYGTKYDTVTGIDYDAYYVQNGMHVYSWELDANSASKSITTVNVTPNKTTWYSVAVLGVLAVTVCVVLGIRIAAKRKKGENK